jgi:hypothetical protein
MGKKSRNQSLSPLVQVASAWKLLLVGFKPCTATILYCQTARTNVRLSHILNVGAFRRNELSQKVPGHRRIVELHTLSCHFAASFGHKTYRHFVVSAMSSSMVRGCLSE